MILIRASSSEEDSSRARTSPRQISCWASKNHLQKHLHYQQQLSSRSSAAQHRGLARIQFWLGSILLSQALLQKAKKCSWTLLAPEESPLLFSFGLRESCTESRVSAHHSTLLLCITPQNYFRLRHYNSEFIWALKNKQTKKSIARLLLSQLISC